MLTKGEGVINPKILVDVSYVKYGPLCDAKLWSFCCRYILLHISTWAFTLADCIEARVRERAI